jgi:general L-amino acid transport system substrate-binding protein
MTSESGLAHDGAAVMVAYALTNNGFAMRKLLALTVSLFALCIGVQASTLEDVKARGKLNCGVNAGLLGFAEKGSDGTWAGMDVDYCKALAAATLGDASKVEYVPLTAQERFEKLKAGAVDVLSRNTTWTMERETKYPFRFVGVMYHDGQGFLVKKLSGVVSVFNMSQAAICFVSGTTTQANVEDFFKEREMAFVAKVFDKPDAAIAAFEANECDAYTADQSQLYAIRLKLSKPEENIVLPEVISKEPLGPAVRVGDEQWFNIARWTLFALVDAEEMELRGPNVAEAKATSKKAGVRRLLGVEGTFGVDLGLDADWATRAIAAVGNYGEMFDRNLGAASKLQIERGLNNLWDKGGVLYAPPVR